MKAFYDFVRIALACGVFVLLDPTVSKWLEVLPVPFPDIIGVILASILSWITFQLINPTTQIRFSWRDAADGPEEEGPLLNIRAHSQQPGQTYAVEAQRDTSTFVGRAVLRGFVRSNVRILIEASQTELQMVIQSESVFVQKEGSAIAVYPSMPKHPVNDVPFELDLNWDENARSDFEATLKFDVVTDHFISTWLARLLVWVHPSVRRVRKVAVNG